MQGVFFLFKKKKKTTTKTKPLLESLDKKTKKMVCYEVNPDTASLLEKQ